LSVNQPSRASRGPEDKDFGQTSPTAADVAAGGAGVDQTVVGAGIIGDISMYITSIIDTSVQQSERRMLARLASLRSLLEQPTPGGVAPSPMATTPTNVGAATMADVRTQQQVQQQHLLHQQKQWQLWASKHANATYQGSASQRTHSATHPSQWHRPLPLSGACGAPSLAGNACVRTVQSEPPAEAGMQEMKRAAVSPLRGRGTMSQHGTSAAHAIAVGSTTGIAASPAMSRCASNNNSIGSSMAAAAMAAHGTIARLSMPLRGSSRTRPVAACQSPMVTRHHRIGGRGTSAAVPASPRTVR